MPFRLKLRRTRRYNVLSKNYFVTRIRLLDGNVIECTLSVESTGQECLEAVAQRLELREVRTRPQTPSTCRERRKKTGPRERLMRRASPRLLLASPPRSDKSGKARKKGFKMVSDGRASPRPPSPAEALSGSNEA